MRTNAGKAYQAGVMADPDSTGTGDYASAHYIGLTSDDTEENEGSVALTDEATGDLARAAAAYAYNAGAGSYTLVKSFTSDQSITIRKIGVFNAAAGGTLVFETLLDAPAILQPSDPLQITQTVIL